VSNTLFEVDTSYKCKYGIRDYWGEYDCTANTTLECEYCKFGVGRKNPLAKCNQIKKPLDKRTTK